MTKPKPSFLRKFLPSKEDVTPDSVNAALVAAVKAHYDLEQSLVDQGFVLGYAAAYDDVIKGCKQMSNFGLLAVQPIVKQMQTKMRKL